MKNNFEFERFDHSTILSYTTVREGELKLGQTLHESFEHTDVKYVILGIQESIGPIANHGNSGAENAFESFLKRFLNMQSNDFFNGENTAIHGRIIQHCQFGSIDQSRELVQELDALVCDILRPIFNAGKIPIVIGGGHNNAFPIIKAHFENSQQEIAVVNLDPHADCRKPEGRHSGNPFSYAQINGYLDTYTVLGLHKAYNSQYLLDFLKEQNFNHTYFDDYVLDRDALKRDITSICDEYGSMKHAGVELDLDAIQHMPTSAYSPSGITLEEARYYIRFTALLPNLRYLHLPEGAPTNQHEEKIVGKALAYLVWEFLHSRTKNFT